MMLLDKLPSLLVEKIIVSILYLQSSAVAIIFNGTRIWPPLQTVADGDMAYIYCESKSFPIWSHNGNRSRINDMNYIVSRDFLVISKASKLYSGVYTCTGLTTDGKKFEASSTLIVSIIQNDRIHPRKNRVILGTTAQFKCDSDSPVKWAFKNGPLLDNTYPIANNFLKITQVRLRHGGIYECRGKFGVNLQDFIAKGELKVYDQNIIKPSTRLVVRKDKDTVFYCLSNRTLNWIFNDKDFPHNAMKYHRLGKSMVTIVGATLANQGYYECSGQTDRGEKFAARIEVIVYIDDHKRLSPPYQLAYIGQTVHFVCLSDAKVKWGFLDHPLPANVRPGYINGTKKYWLKIELVQLSNCGTYYCVGKNYENNYTFHARAELEVSIECPKLSLNNGFVKLTGTEIGDMSIYSCKHNFILEGSNKRQCIPGGDWSGLQPECIHVASKMYHISSYVLFIFFSPIMQWLMYRRIEI